jgi:hypothetical protein
MIDDPQTPQPGQFWRHRNGILYRVLFVANEGSDSPTYPPTVCYYTADRPFEHARKWARQLHDWHRSMTLEAQP